jgi:hypothetical protein
VDEHLAAAPLGAFCLYRELAHENPDPPPPAGFRLVTLAWRRRKVGTGRPGEEMRRQRLAVVDGAGLLAAREAEAAAAADGWAIPQRADAPSLEWVKVCVCVCVRACVRAHARAR